MPRPDHAPDGVRFFARVDRFVCECPACGHLIHAYFDHPAKVRRQEAQRKRPSAPRRHVYNPLTSRVCCPLCRRIWAVGLILYPVARRAPSKQPTDQKPTYRQLLALRQYAGGILAEQVRQGDDAVNVAICADCTCPDSYGAWAPACPIHGWERTKAWQAAHQGEPPPSTDSSE